MYRVTDKVLSSILLSFERARRADARTRDFFSPARSAQKRTKQTKNKKKEKKNSSGARKGEGGSTGV